MKLRNKKTGEIKRVGFLADYQNDDGTEIGFRVTDTLDVYSYNSLSELSAEWEDAPEEPKHDYYFIRDGGNIDCHWYQKLGEITERRKEIGNYFETKEEAEKVVEKLKAWKRLKDKGFVFKGINEGDGSIKTGLSKGVSLKDAEEFYECMNLLFGGEE